MARGGVWGMVVQFLQLLRRPSGSGETHHDLEAFA